MVKKSRIVVFFLLLLLIGGTIGATITNTTSNIKLGLDLQGGFEILYEVDTVNGEGQVTKDVLVSTVEALNKRVNVLGVNEPNIQIEGEDRIRVQLAGVDNQNKAREILSTQAKLTFHDVDDKLLLDGTDLVEGGAKQSFDENNQPIVSLKLKDANKFGEITREISRRPAPENRIVIWLDFEEGVDSYANPESRDKILSDARVTQTLKTSDVMITGNFTIQSANELAELLNAGALPVELTEIYSTSVGAQFGEKALGQTVFAGMIGIALVFLFMIFYYRVPGIISVITLSTYIYLVLLIFDWMNGVLTLPGIAALILGVGMAVDANIITYERIKDEIKSGKTILSAFRAGSRNSLSTIFDANITTIIAGAVLFMYGTSSVKGFATMLIVSILVSFLTAVFLSRLLLGLWVNSRFLNKKASWFGVKEKDIVDIEVVKDPTTVIDNKLIDFVSHRKRYFTVSIAMVVIGIILLSTLKLNLGIDFASGTRVEVLAEQQLTKEEIQEDYSELELAPKEIVISGNDKEIGVARFLGVLSQEEIADVKTYFGEKYGAEPNISTVSPTVGKELARNAFIAVLIASLGIILYVTIRFEIFFALAAIIALLHDAFFIIVFFSIVRMEVDITFIAAVLTIVGYSINDTIVTFDRIRENLKLEKKVKGFADLALIVNRSLRQTLGRSINTVLTLVFTVVALLIFGSESIRNFSFALIIGLLAGTYSSLFIAAQLWLIWKNKQLTRKRHMPTENDPEAEPEV